MPALSLHDLTAALADRPANDLAAVRVVDGYEPAGGPAAKVFPPTYAVDRTAEHPYVIETRWVGGAHMPTVVLDSVAAQANEVEQALLDAVDRGELALPLVETRTEAHERAFRITSLDAPHRIADAYFRDSETEDGTRFSVTPLGRAVRKATLRDATVLYRWCPTALVYGVWDSHRGRPELSLKIARSYVSELYGVDPQVGKRVGSRLDPIGMLGGTVALGDAPDDWELVEVVVEAGGEDGAKQKTEQVGTARGKGGKDKLSNTGHGNVAPGIGTGGVSIATAVRRASLSLAGLRRLRFPTDGTRDPDRDAAGRAVLAALGLVGDRLAFDVPSLSLRSGCELVQTGSAVELVSRGGETQAIALDADAALALLAEAREAARGHGLAWEDEPLVLRPRANLQKAIEVNVPELT